MVVNNHMFEELQLNNNEYDEGHMRLHIFNTIVNMVKNKNKEINEFTLYSQRISEMIFLVYICICIILDKYNIHVIYLIMFNVLVPYMIMRVFKKRRSTTRSYLNKVVKRFNEKNKVLDIIILVFICQCVFYRISCLYFLIIVEVIISVIVIMDDVTYESYKKINDILTNDSD